MNKKHISQSFIKEFATPILTSYVHWILTKAQQNGITKLYFLARDGYLLREIALLLCQEMQIDISCKYLFCSRAALRMPSYHLIGEEAFELLLQENNNMTPSVLLERIRLTPEEQTAILTALGITDDNKNNILTKNELEELRQKLKTSNIYRKLVIEKSKRAYKDTIDYLRQEDLFDTNTVAIVDSGWAGTLQRSLRQLMESAGYTGQLIGFYYGLYSTPGDPKDGIYYSYLFNPNSNLWTKVHFNSSFFECMLPAPHGMTMGYSNTGVQCIPEMVDSLVDLQFIMEYVSQVKTNVGHSCIMSKKKCRYLINHYMVHPTKELASTFGNICFCDDITETKHTVLAKEEYISELESYLLISRIKKKLGWATSSTVSTLYWPYGVVAFLPSWKQWWYRANIIIWSWIRILLKKNKK